jgi:flagellar hook-associated protein 2
MCEGGNRMLIGSVPYTGSTNRIASTVSAISPVLSYKSKFTYQQATGSWLQSSSNAFEQMAKSAAAGIAAETTGITSITSIAANASYSVNGAVNQTSQSNTIDLEKGKVTATFLKPTSDAVKIDVRPDEKKALEQVGQLISNYGDGTLKLDEAKFKQSLSANYEQTNRALTGNKGLATSLEKETDRFNDISASALLNQKMQAMQQFATYQSTQQSYLQIPTTGLLINGIF